jgi:1,2-diacylglycerol 3-beta-galactosyltransferase
MRRQTYSSSSAAAGDVSDIIFGEEEVMLSQNHLSVVDVSGYERSSSLSSFSLPWFNAPKKVLIIMSDTGGGHRASAQALKDSLKNAYGNKLDVEIVDFITDYCGWPFNNAVQNYKIMAKHPWMWKLSYYLTCFPPMRWLGQMWFNAVSTANFVEAFEKYDPDMVVSVHPLLQALPVKVLQKRDKDVPFVTVVTDLGGAHPTWFNRQVGELFVPSDRVEGLARRNGVPQCKIRKYGLPIRGTFQKPAGDKQEMRRNLNIEDMPTALLVGGGDGVGGLGQIAKALGKEIGEKGTPKQLVVVCGSNAALREELSAYDWPEGVHVSVQGFVTNMDEWMAAADCLVTKAGPGTIAEAASRGLPVMLSNFLPGQEAGNVKFVVEGGFGQYSPKPNVIAKTVSGWLDDSALLEEMSAKALSAAHPEATQQIADDIGRMAIAGAVENECP